jgi:eukaryotic-like serine/threonine-protein kinase
MVQSQHLARYTIETTIVEGPNNIIYKGYDSLQNRVVSLKTIRDEHLNSSLDLRPIERLRWESQLGSRVSHPNIVTVYEYYFEESQPFLVMEYLDGESLKQILHSGQRFNLVEIVEIISQVLAALSHIHQAGIVHRDIKPGNIILLDCGLVKVSDFGVACVVGEESTQSSRVAGTPAYMAPEQIIGTKIDGRCDLFSVGTLLYELISGQKPFIAPDKNSIIQKILTTQPARPSSLNSSISKVMDSAVMKAMAKRPSERFQSAEEFLAALDL